AAPLRGSRRQEDRVGGRRVKQRNIRCRVGALVFYTDRDRGVCPGRRGGWSTERYRDVRRRAAEILHEHVAEHVNLGLSSEGQPIRAPAHQGRSTLDIGLHTTYGQRSDREEGVQIE